MADGTGAGRTRHPDERRLDGRDRDGPAPLRGEQEAADDPDRTADEILRARGARRPLGRLGQPEDLADAVLWLASDRADYVVGDIVRVSGGGNLE